MQSIATKVLTLPGVFRPRSDTWLLARALLDWVTPGASVLDLCTGSGVLAVLAARAGATDVTAVDSSRRALASTRLNARLANVRVHTLHGDLFEPLGARRFDLIVSNPPYLPSPRTRLGRHTPARAWEAGPGGRLLLDRICAVVAAHLLPGGTLLLVQSSLAGAPETIARLTHEGLAASAFARRRGRLGPLLSARAGWLERRGLLAPGSREEELVVIAARAPRQAAVAPAPVRV